MANGHDMSKHMRDQHQRIQKEIDDFRSKLERLKKHLDKQKEDD